MIQAMFFDIDGTLIDSTTHVIPTSTLEALLALKINGYKIAIASGRDLKNMKLIHDLDLTLFDGFVVNNGMCLYDNRFQCISKHVFTHNDIVYLLNYANEHQITLIFESENDLYVANNLNCYVDIANEYYHETTPYQRKWKGEEIFKVSLFHKLGYDFSELAKQLHITIVSSPTTTYDITLKSISKLTGIHEMMQYWGLSHDAFMCFGDHENDIEMIRGAEIGVAVKDALGFKGLQELADDVCLSAKEDGIYHYLKEHHYI